MPHDHEKDTKTETGKTGTGHQPEHEQWKDRPQPQGGESRHQNEQQGREAPFQTHKEQRPGQPRHDERADENETEERDERRRTA